MSLKARPQSFSFGALARFRQASDRLLRHTVALIALVAIASPAIAQQTTPTAGKGTITGVVKDVSTGQPVEGATVKVAGLGSAVLTKADGRYSIPVNLGAQVVLEASRIGYTTIRVDVGRVDQPTVTKDFTMNSAAISLEAVTSSATTDPTSGVKVPFAMARLDADQMPVPNLTNAAASIQGKVAGVVVTQMSGDPNDSTSVVLRSIVSPFHSINPLYVVDGVPLNSGTSFSTGDFSGLDVESIEVIRGAAAAALYGSRAAGGVIAITTRRGKDVAIGSSQLEFRQDFGYDQIAEYPERRTSHLFRINDKLQWINSSGIVVSKSGRGNDPNLFQDNPYASSYDPVADAMSMNRSLTSRVAVTQSSATTNINLSFNRTRQPGTLKFADGNTQNIVRFSISHQLKDNLQLSTTAQHTRSAGDETVASFSQLFAWDPDVNLLAANPPGSVGDGLFPYWITPDSASTTLNPLYQQWKNDNNTRRMRTLVQGDVSYRPFNWLTARASLGYDKSDEVIDRYEAPGLPDGGTSTTVGSLRYDEKSADGLSGEAGVTFLRDVGRLTPRLTLRSRFEREDDLTFRSSGTSLNTGFRTLSNAVNKVTTSSVQANRINAHTANLGLDYGGKYIGDFLYLYEGNSRFGPEHRWNGYYRAAGSWLMSEESWYPSFLSPLSLFKFRYSYGTAGNQPNFGDQYETIQVSTLGAGFIRSELGNPNLAPEMKYDHEMGLDLILNNKVSMQLTYTRSTVHDAIVGNAAASISGYNTVQANIGTTRGETIEGTIEGEWVKTRIRGKSFRWWSNLVVDRSQATVVDLGRPPYCNVGYHCTADGVPPTSIWGYTIMTRPEQLAQYAPSLAKYQDRFEVDDRGFLVPVGVGNHYWEGVSKNLWGTKVDIGPARNQVDWGVPQTQFIDTTGGVTLRRYEEIGNSQQLANVGIGNRFNYGNLLVYFHFRGAIGGDIWNTYSTNQVINGDDPIRDMQNVPDSLKKISWYFNDPNDFAGMSVNNSSYAYTPFLTSNSWAKFGELSLQYSMASRDFKFLNKMGAERLNLQLRGTDLYTFKNGYTGMNPESFVNVGNTTGAYIRRDQSRYPATRKFSGSVTVIF